MSTSILLINLILLGVVLETDLGRRKVTVFRVARPIVTASTIVPFFLAGASTTTWGLALEAVGTALGAGLGLLAGALLPVYRDPASGRIRSHGGLGYALLWIAVTGARLLFAYGAQHWFPHALGTFLANHQISSDALGDAFIFFSLAMFLARTGSLLAHSYSCHRSGAEQSTTRQHFATVRGH